MLVDNYVRISFPNQFEQSYTSKPFQIGVHDFTFSDSRFCLGSEGPNETTPIF
jgi:hypothetical protein